jgi:hypothetical protein
MRKSTVLKKATERYGQKVAPFIEDTFENINECGGKVSFENKKEIKFSPVASCSGYFECDEKIPSLVCAINKDWLGIYVHEYCHFQQWAEKTRFYDKRTRIYYSGGVVEEWLMGEKHPLSMVRKAVKDMQECELDCERRAVKLIKEYELPIDVDLYIQKANAYLMFYNYVFIRRKWDVKKQKNKHGYSRKILNKMPKNFMRRYDIISMELMCVFDEEYGTW